MTGHFKKRGVSGRSGSNADRVMESRPERRASQDRRPDAAVRTAQRG